MAQLEEEHFQEEEAENAEAEKIKYDSHAGLGTLGLAWEAEWVEQNDWRGGWEGVTHIGLGGPL